PMVAYSISTSFTICWTCRSFAKGPIHRKGNIWQNSRTFAEYGYGKKEDIDFGCYDQSGALCLSSRPPVSSRGPRHREHRHKKRRIGGRGNTTCGRSCPRDRYSDPLHRPTAAAGILQLYPGDPSKTDYLQSGHRKP